MQTLLATLQTRFKQHPHRHPGLAWSAVLARLHPHPDRLRVLAEMERTGGEPDVVGGPREGGACLFMDCSPETPKGRVGACYDRPALDARKEFKPKHNALDSAAALGATLLTEDQYHELQRVGAFDTKTSIWLHTPAEVRALGGALFGDRRYGRVFIYHNGASSYFAVRGFRVALLV